MVLDLSATPTENTHPPEHDYSILSVLSASTQLTHIFHSVPVDTFKKHTDFRKIRFRTKDSDIHNLITFLLLRKHHLKV